MVEEFDDGILFVQAFKAGQTMLSYWAEEKVQSCRWLDLERLNVCFFS